MNQKQIDKALKQHRLWLEDNRLGKHANLANVDLSGLDLRFASLRRANLRDANLQNADLSDADLYCADLSFANLRGAYLQGASLQGASLQSANLQYANLQYTNLQNADLSGAQGIPDYVVSTTSICPDGDLIVYKKAAADSRPVLLTLLIPKEAKRSNATGRKCRAEWAILQDIQGVDWQYDGGDVRSFYDDTFVYPPIGQKVMPNRWDDNRWVECSYGIHFYLTKDEALRQ